MSCELPQQPLPAFGPLSACSAMHQCKRKQELVQVSFMQLLGKGLTRSQEQSQSERNSKKRQRPSMQQDRDV
eukprot:1015777-Amphidinium_carterae.1